MNPIKPRKPGTRIPHPCLSDPRYDSVKAINWMIKKLGCRTDADLCLKLDVDRPCISKIRHRRQAIGDSMLIKLHKITNMQIRFIEAELGMYEIKSDDNNLLTTKGVRE